MNPKTPGYKYTIKSIYNAHTADVRVVKPTIVPESGLITGSRDNLVKVWSPEGKYFKESHVFSGPTTFIASLCVLPPSAQYPDGLFLAGSNDCSIYGFVPDFAEPVLKLHGHSGPVCSLSYGKFGFFVSGSWDKSARVWFGQQCVLVLQGHLEAVWATGVFPSQNLILTGSADRTIRLWRTDVCEKVFEGHEDCVRDLNIISDMKFLSCANDNTVRLWLTSGECLKVFRSHSDYIYSITLLNNGADFASCGEDQSLKIWSNDECIQTIIIAPKSLWSVACLSNGDLAVGTSEGKVYIFEKVPDDYFENAASSFTDFEDEAVASQERLDNKTDIYNGETLITYGSHSDSMYVCQYNNETGTKVKKEALDVKVINDTMYKKPVDDAVTLNGASSKKSDYEFDVDVENTIYKLAFNKGENAWAVANKFVAEHNLQTDHVAQIVDYILQNTSSSFTNDCYPVKSYCTYFNVNIVGLRAKLLEFTKLVPKDKYVSPEEIEDLVILAHLPDDISIEQMSSLDKVISWNDEHIFPVLDLLRLAIRCKGLTVRVCSKEFMNHLLHIFMNTKQKVNRLLVEKILCNMFGIEEAEGILEFYQDKIFESVKEVLSSREQSLEKAGSALFLNFAVASYNGFSISTKVFCSNMIEILNCVSDTEAIYRLLVAMGTSCTRNPLAVTYFRAMNIKDILSKYDVGHAMISQVIAFLSSDF